MKIKSFFEQIEKSEIEVGDYVLMKPFDWLSGASPSPQKRYKEFINNNIGIVIFIHIDNIYVKYYNTPLQIKYLMGKDYEVFPLSYVIEHDKDIEKLKIKIEAKKYNL